MTPSKTQPFAERYGATVLLVVGVALCLAAAAASLLGNGWAQGLAALGLTAIVIGCVLSRMEGEFRFLVFRGKLRPVAVERETRNSDEEGPTR